MKCPPKLIRIIRAIRGFREKRMGQTSQQAHTIKRHIASFQF